LIIVSLLHSAKQPSEKTPDSAANRGSHGAECGPKRGAGGGTARYFIEMPHRAVNMIEFFVGQQHR
jgi:hypothetical protein